MHNTHGEVLQCVDYHMRLQPARDFASPDHGNPRGRFRRGHTPCGVWLISKALETVLASRRHRFEDDAVGEIS